MFNKHLDVEMLANQHKSWDEISAHTIYSQIILLANVCSVYYPPITQSENLDITYTLYPSNKHTPIHTLFRLPIDLSVTLSKTTHSFNKIHYWAHFCCCHVRWSKPNYFSILPLLLINQQVKVTKQRIWVPPPQSPRTWTQPPPFHFLLITPLTKILHDVMVWKMIAINQSYRILPIQLITIIQTDESSFEAKAC